MPPSPPIASPPAGGSSLKGLTVKLVAFIGLALLVFAACFTIQPPAKLGEAGVIMKLPERVLDLTGKDEPISEGERELLPLDTEIAKKRYTRADGVFINSEIVLSGAEHRSIHRPEACLLGQGWTIPAGRIVSVPLKSGRDLEVMVLDINHDMKTPSGQTTSFQALYAYFFVSKDAETPRHFDRIARTNLDLLFHNKSHRWAYVIAMAPVVRGDREQALQMIKDFLREAAPQFIKSEMNVVKS